MRSKRRTRHRLLLDEGVHLPKSYPNLNNLHDLLHVSQAGLKGLSDDKVFSFAEQDSRMIVVFNVKDFKKFIQPDSPTVIALSTNLSDQQADLKICKALKKLKPSETKGHLIVFSMSAVRIRKVGAE